VNLPFGAVDMHNVNLLLGDPQNVMDPLMDVIWCDLRAGRVKYTHYSGSSIRIATITLFSFTLTRTVYSLRTRSHDCLSISFQKDHFTPQTTSFSEALSTLNSNQRTLFLKALVSSEWVQLELKTANTNLHVVGTSHHGVARPKVSDRGTVFE
jgi:hypothetical protein